MSPTKAEARFLKATLQALRDEHEAAAIIRRDTDLQNRRRARIAQKYRQKLWNRALIAANIDLTEIERRQARDLVALRRFAAQQQLAWIAQGRAVAARRRQLARTVQTRKQAIKTPLARDPVYAQLQTPLDISINPEIQGGIIEKGVTPGINTVTAKMDSVGEALSWRFQWVFVWNAPRDGLLNAVAFVDFNGSYILLLQGTCDPTANPDADLVIYPTLSVATTGPDGKLITDFGDSGPPLQDEIRGGSCLGRVESSNYSPSESLTYSKQMPVIQGHQVAFVVDVYVNTYATEGGEVHVDFQSDSFQLNVPLVTVAFF